MYTSQRLKVSNVVQYHDHVVSCNDRMGVYYATILTRVMLQVLASYSM